MYQIASKFFKIVAGHTPGAPLHAMTYDLIVSTLPITTFTAADEPLHNLWLLQ